MMAKHNLIRTSVSVTLLLLSSEVILSEISNQGDSEVHNNEGLHVYSDLEEKKEKPVHDPTLIGHLSIPIKYCI